MREWVSAEARTELSVPRTCVGKDFGETEGER